jgi:signal transduction histidine kinase
MSASSSLTPASSSSSQPASAATHALARLQTYDFLFRSTSDGVLIAVNGAPTDGPRRLVLAQVNPAAAALLSTPAEDLIGRSPEQVFALNPALLNLFSREGDQALDVRLPRRRLATGIAHSLEGGERVVLLQDVTEKREMESRREALVKAMAHDLRNPISAIGGFADLLAKFGELNEQQHKFATRIRQTTTKLYDLVESLVELAWIEAGMPLAHVPVALPDLIHRAVSGLTASARAARVVIATSIQNPMPPVMGDPERLRLVIHHLLHNAILYSVPERVVALHAWEEEGEVYCSVADRGFGIADDELDLVFDRMYRSRDERVRDLPGGGLGLTLARTILRRHGGDIWAASNLGEGSTFTFVLPTAQQTPTGPRPGEAAPESSNADASDAPTRSSRSSGP